MSEDDLPDGWTEASIDEVAARVVVGFVGPSTSHHDPNGIPFLMGKNIKGGVLDLSDLTRVSKAFHSSQPKSSLDPGDVVVVRIGRSGEAAVVPATLGSANCAGLVVIKRPGRVTPEFLVHFLNSPAGQAASAAEVRGVTRRTLNTTSIAAARVPVPPLVEQRRIVAKLDALRARSRRAKDALDAVPALLDRLRQSILAAAFRGDLTAEWREQNPDVEPATELLKRIRVERRKRWEEAELAKMVAKGKAPKDDRWKAKYVEPEPVDESELPELPEGWCWASLGLLGADPLSAVQTGPFGEQLHSSDFVDRGTPVIAVGNLTGLGFTEEGLYFVTSAKAAELARFSVDAGDVLFARSGATLGKVCVAPDNVRDWRMSPHILRVRLRREAIEPRLVVLALRGMPAVVAQVNAGVRGMTRPGFNTALLENIAIPVAPRKEQTVLVQRVDAYLARLRSLVDTRRGLIDSLDDLDAAILAAAFRGELLDRPSDPPPSAP